MRNMKKYKNGRTPAMDINFAIDTILKSPETEEVLEIIRIYTNDGELKILVGNDKERWLHTLKTEEVD